MARLVPLFALAEVVVIHLPTQSNAHGHTLREIPAVLGLTFLVPQQYVTAYVVGAVVALVVAARMRGVKLAFNAAMFALEAALGALVYHAILQGGDPLSMTGWLAVLVAVLVTDLMSAGAVTAAISLTEGVFDGEVLQRGAPVRVPSLRSSIPVSRSSSPPWCWSNLRPCPSWASSSSCWSWAIASTSPSPEDTRKPSCSTGLSTAPRRRAPGGDHRIVSRRQPT